MQTIHLKMVVEPSYEILCVLEVLEISSTISGVVIQPLWDSQSVANELVFCFAVNWLWFWSII